MIFDTNALSAVADNERGAVRLFNSAPLVALPVIVLGEYRYGIARSRRRTEYERWLAELVGLSTVLSVDEVTSQHYAAIRLELRPVGMVLPANDVWIAALCRQHGLPILSRDKHFDAVPGVRRIAW